MDVGRFLCELANLHPEYFYVGLELRPEAAAAAQDRVKNNGITNAIGVEAEAEAFIHHWPVVGVVDVVHVYHPTPHPFLLGLNHRLVNQSFVRGCERILRAWGTLRIVTDHEKYFDHAMRVFSPKRWWTVDWVYEPIAVARSAYVGSPTELGQRKSGKTIFAAQFVRRP